MFISPVVALICTSVPATVTPKTAVVDITGVIVAVGVLVAPGGGVGVGGMVGVMVGVVVAGKPMASDDKKPVPSGDDALQRNDPSGLIANICPSVVGAKTRVLVRGEGLNSMRGSVTDPIGKAHLNTPSAASE
jgi:hypothetical protein